MEEHVKRGSYHASPVCTKELNPLDVTITRIMYAIFT